MQAQVAPHAVPMQIRHAAAATRAPPDRTEGHDRKLLLKVGLAGAQSEEFLNLGWPAACLFHLGDDLPGGRRLPEVEQNDFCFLLAFSFNREVVGDDVGVDRIVVADGNPLKIARGKTSGI